MSEAMPVDPMTQFTDELRALVAEHDLTPHEVTSVFLRVVIRSSIDAGIPNSIVIGALKRGFHMERAINGER